MATISSQTNISVDHLKDISAWVSFAHDLTQLLELILQTGSGIMSAEAGSLLLLNQNTQKLHFKIATGKSRDEVKKFEIKLGEGIAGYVAQTGEPLLIPDATKDPRWHKYISDQIGFKTHSIACVPMKIDNHIIGVIEFINKDNEGEFTSEDVALISVFCELAAVAIMNARTFELVQKENTGLKQELNINHPIIGDSPVIKQVLSDALKVADSNASVLITGESGTGKELLARIIHLSSPRKSRHMVTLNCAAIPESLLEGELFGHEKGAFTGADARKMGKFELADESTIFLDEIAEMSPAMQAKLLRVIQDSVFYRVGGNTPLTVDIRVISATNKNLVQEINSQKFREDLYYRLRVVEIEMPPLRDRKEDIPLLARYFADLFKSNRGLYAIEISDAALEKMTNYDWPGNVRELQNAIERAVVMGNGEMILPEDLPMINARTQLPWIQQGLTLQNATHLFKKEFIRLNLKKVNGSRKKAASIMGIQRTYLSRLISKYGIK